MPFNQKIGKEIIPLDVSWAESDFKDRLAFFREAGIRAIRIKQAELASGIGSNGQRMKPRKRPRPDKANGPVLTPHREDSRTSRLMASHATVESLTLFWRAGISRAQRTAWGTILGFHAAGQVPGAPVRDVRRSKRGINKLRLEMLAWWYEHYGERLRAARDARLTEEDRAARRRQRPGIAARAKKAVQKKYKGLAAYFNPRGGGFD